MAFEKTLIKSDIKGTSQEQVYSCTFTAVTAGYIKTGFSNILYALVMNETTAGAGIAKKNIASDGIAVEGGGLYFSGLTAGNVITVVVVGV